MRQVKTASGLANSQIVVLVALAVSQALFEGIGIGLLLPVLQYLESGVSAVAETGGAIWTLLLNVSSALGLPLNLGTLLAMAFVPILARQLAYYAYTAYSTRVQVGIVKRLRAEGFATFIGADLSFFGEEGRTALMSALTGQADWAGSAIFTLLSLLSVTVMAALYVFILLFVSPILTLVAVVAVAATATVARWSVRRSREDGKEASAATLATYKAVGERVDAVRLIKMRGQEKAESDRLTEILDRLANAQIRIGLSKARVEVTVDPALMLAVFVIIYFGSSLGLYLSSLGLFLFVLLRLNNKAKEFSVLRQTLVTSIDFLLTVTGFTDRAAATAGHVSGGSREFTGLTQGVTASHLAFSYQQRGRVQVLRDASFAIPAKSVIALVGKSGSGKSTLVDILARLREASDGELEYDCISAKELDVRSVRRRIGFMTQDSVFFDDTILNNLTYGMDSKPREERVWEVLKQSYADGFVRELPEGLQTRMGELGMRLSGGQRQRLALARELMWEPDLLLLDEPTSALDAESERYIQAALDQIRGTLTLVVIAHRLPTVQSADLILVLDEGRVVEQGTHEDLIRRGGLYQRLFEQSLGE